MKPDFIIAGGARCGTTFFADCLNQHPDIYLPTPFIPEPKVFTDPFMEDEYYLDHYEDIYDSNPFITPDTVNGEKTVNYLENPNIPFTIRRVLPDVKMFFCLRNPVDRAYSGWCWSVMNGHETKSFKEAIHLELTTDRWRWIPKGMRSQPFNYLHRSMYDVMLENYFKAFRKNQIHIILFEELIKDIHTTVNNVYHTLGVYRQHVKSNFKNETEGFPLMANGYRQFLRGYFYNSIQNLSEYVNVDIWEGT
jgi:hypothetical protein